ncbi:MAG: COX15/CtaA family protein [Bacteroidia bacterium]
MLFVLGGLVRATGAGMGCPDWPKCFGEYIPPTSAEKLPENYKEIFLSERLKKTERFAALLTKLGMEQKAQEILAYDALNDAHEFNAGKAYTEYVNRLWGAFTGIVVLLTLIASFKLFRSNKKLFWFTVFGFLAVMVNALIGAVVVNANLLGGIVTIHFLAAFAAISFFMLARFQILKAKPLGEISKRFKVIAPLFFVIILVQLILGTQVREAYDIMESAGEKLSVANIHMLGGAFNGHRTLALIALIFSYLQYNELRIKHKKELNLKRLASYMLWIVVAQIVFGSLIVMTDLSAFSKLFHISLGAALFIIQFYICSHLFGSKPRLSILVENS